MPMQPSRDCVVLICRQTIQRKYYRTPAYLAGRHVVLDQHVCVHVPRVGLVALAALGHGTAALSAGTTLLQGDYEDASTLR